MTDKQKRLVEKIQTTVYRQLHQQLLLEITRTQCDIEYILLLNKKAKGTELSVIEAGHAIKNSRKWLNYLEFQLSTIEEKEGIPEEIGTLHRKQIQQFRRHYAEIDRINRWRIKNEHI